MKPGLAGKRGIRSAVAARPAATAREAISSASAVTRIGLVKNEPALRWLSSAGSITIDFSLRRPSTASRTSASGGGTWPATALASSG